MRRRLHGGNCISCIGLAPAVYSRRLHEVSCNFRKGGPHGVSWKCRECCCQYTAAVNPTHAVPPGEEAIKSRVGSDTASGKRHKVPTSRMNGRDNDVCVWDAFGAFWCESQQTQHQYGPSPNKPVQQSTSVGALIEGFKGFSRSKMPSGSKMSSGSKSSTRSSGKIVGIPSVQSQIIEAQHQHNMNKITSQYRKKDDNRSKFTNSIGETEESPAPVPSAEGFCGCMLP